MLREIANDDITLLGDCGHLTCLHPTLVSYNFDIDIL